METTCPDEEMLADYLEGRLSDEENSFIEEHLTQCDHCLEVFEMSGQLIHSPPERELGSVPLAVTDAAVRLALGDRSEPFVSLNTKLKRFLTHFHSSLSERIGPLPWGRYALSPIRGTKKVLARDLIHLKKTFREIEAEIEIEKTGKNRAHIRVTILQANGLKSGIRVTLKREEREISSILYEEGGYVLFENIPFGQYSLDFDRDGLKLGTYIFTIKESHHGG